MYSWTARSLLLTLASVLIALPVFGQDRPPADSSGQAVADTVRQRAWEHFRQKHGAQWNVRWSDRAQIGRSPTRADAGKAPATVFGALTQPYGGPPEQAARAFLSAHHNLFQMPKDLSNLEVANAVTLRGVTHVHFRQTYQGIPIYEGEYLVHVRKDGRIDMANGTYYAEIDAPTSPSISESSARRAAIEDLGGTVELEENAEVRSELVIYPKNDGDAFLLTWKVLVPAVEPQPGSWQYFINAVTGAVVDRSNLATTIARPAAASKREATATGKGLSSSEAVAGAKGEPDRSAVTGDGTIIPDYPTATSSEQRNFTNLDGNGRLNGFFTNVDNEEASNAHESDHDFFYGTGSTHFDEVNVYYHITAFFNQYVVPVLGFTGDIGSDRDVESEVHDQEKPTNAYYDPNGEKVAFGDTCPISGGSCLFAREDKIVYHESVHAILDAINGDRYFKPDPNEEGAVGEGVSDYLAGGFTDRIEGPTDSKIIRGALASYFPQRDMANPLSGIDTYSEYQNREPVEEHDGGEFFSAVLWDLRQDFSVDTDDIDAIVLAAAARVDGSPNFMEYRDAMLAENNSNYGGQYTCQIKRAFANRGIGGDPFTVWIASGPTVLDPGEEGTWSPSTNCAPGSVSYDWSYSPQGSPNSYDLGSGPSVSHSFYESVGLSVEASSGGKTATGTWDILVSEGDCKLPPCPSSTASSGEQSGLAKQSRLSKRDRPTEFALRENRPNPVRTQTTIRYALPEASHVTLTVYDVMGRRVAYLVQSAKAAGHHTAQFDASGVPSGVYVYRLQAGSFAEAKRFTVVK